MKPVFGEWRMPIMIASMSGVFFILITALFGVTINTNTREVAFHMNPGDDWDLNPITNTYGEKDDANPMGQFPEWMYIPFVAGYFLLLLTVIHVHYDYCKWKVKYIEKNKLNGTNEK